MYAPGNHEDEAYYEFDAYETRFYTSGSNPFWYSFSFEGIYFISLSSEHDYEPGSQQYNWLEGELQGVDRQATPWLVVFAHRPMYSSNSAHGSEVDFRDAMEELLYDYGVDLAVWGHDHSYERTYPVFQEEPLSNFTSSAVEPYRDPGAPIHVVVGTAGRSIYDEFDEPQPAWSAYREAAYGYTVFEVTVQGELHFSFVRNSDGAVADQFWISKAEPPPEPDGLVPDPPPDGAPPPSPRNSFRVTSAEAHRRLGATSSAMMSIFERFSPSWVSQVRWSSRP